MIYTNFIYSAREPRSYVAIGYAQRNYDKKIYNHNMLTILRSEEDKSNDYRLVRSNAVVPQEATSPLWTIL